MLEKLPSAIESIELNRATFNDVLIKNLTFVNFFFGKNGVGKTSISQAIAENDGLSWRPGRLAEDFDVLVFDQDFINKNFASYADLPGVFTFGKEDREAKEKIEALQKLKAENSDKLYKLENQISKAIEDKNQELKSSREDIANKAKTDRDLFKSALKGWYQSGKFVDEVLGVKNPEEQNLDKLRQFYDMVFENPALPLKRFKSPRILVNMAGIEDLLTTSFKSCSETEFTSFMNVLSASDWVHRGFEEYEPKANGKCPYCQQVLPENFESIIEEAFDKKYKNDLEKLKKFQKEYASATKDYVTELESNIYNNEVPSGDKDKLQRYSDKLDELKKGFEINRQRINRKIEKPSEVIEFESTTELLDTIFALIKEINADIDEQNRVIENRKSERSKCIESIKEYFAFKLAGDIEAYQSRAAQVEKNIEELKVTESETKEKLDNIDKEIVDLNKRNINTEAAVNSINKDLYDSGFQGFNIKAKSGEGNLYEVVRDGLVVKNLSEGERNFIAFLYFAHLVKGSLDPEKLKEKVVVIDDPVSALDKEHLSIVGSIVSEMICSCEAGAQSQDLNDARSQIRQIFILTHNIPFYDEIIKGQSAEENCVSFYLVQKGEENRSYVQLCDNLYAPVERMKSE